MPRTNLSAAGGALPVANLDRRHFIATGAAATVALPFPQLDAHPDAELFAIVDEMRLAHAAFLHAIDQSYPFEEKFLNGKPKTPDWFEPDEIRAAGREACAQWEDECGYTAALAEVSRRSDDCSKIEQRFFDTRARTIEGLHLKATHAERYELLDDSRALALLASIAADLKAFN